MTAAEFTEAIAKMIDEMRKLQNKTVTNNDWFTIQQCIDIVKNVEKEETK